jgi:very-long-chain enoyl-CoA reductase
MPVYVRGRELEGVPVSPSSTVLDLRRAIAAALRKSVHRVELRERDAGGGGGGRPGTRIDGDARLLSSFGLTRESQVDVKDLGPQVPYRLVFVAEYVAPLCVLLAVALGSLSQLPAPLQSLLGAPGEFAALDIAGALRGLRDARDGSPAWNRAVQALGAALYAMHFVKRIAESIFVHKFSRPTMPLSGLWRNVLYYGGFAAFICVPLCSARYTAPPRAVVLPAAAAWVAAEAINLAVHLQLAAARAGGDGDKTRNAPGGVLFSLVSCPNYSAEAAAWVAWTVLTHVAASAVFTLVGFATMSAWALQKHEAYKKADPSYARLGRKAIVPFLL